jgi:hypothetical protein
MDCSLHREESIPDKNTEGGLDPLDIANPAIAYFFLSDDVRMRSAGETGKR